MNSQWVYVKGLSAVHQQQNLSAEEHHLTDRKNEPQQAGNRLFIQ